MDLFRQDSEDGFKRKRKTPDATIDGTDAMASSSEEAMGNKGERAKTEEETSIERENNDISMNADSENADMASTEEIAMQTPKLSKTEGDDALPSSEKGPATKRTQKSKKSSTAKDKATKRENSPTTKKEIEINESEPALGLFHSDKVPEDIKRLTHRMDDMLHRRYSYMVPESRYWFSWTSCSRL